LPPIASDRDLLTRHERALAERYRRMYPWLVEPPQEGPQRPLPGYVTGIPHRVDPEPDLSAQRSIKSAEAPGR
jgi:hypothetical protein